MPVARHQAIEAARRLLDVTVIELWIDCIALGGNLAASALTAFLAGTRELSDHDQDVIAHALNERFSDEAMDHPLAYAEDLPRP